MMNKKGGEKILSIWWFFILGLVGIAVVGGVLLFYSADFDSRNAEAEIIYDKLANCLNEGGFVDLGLFDDSDKIFAKCGLSREIFDKGYFYFRVTIFDSSGNKEKEISSKVGGSFETECNLGEHYPKCVPRKEPILFYKNGKVEKGTMEILAGSNQIGEKIASVKLE